MALPATVQPLALEHGQRDALAFVSDAVDVGCVVTDPNLVVLIWNRWLEDASGINARDAVGRSLLDIFPDMTEPAADAFRRAANGEPVMFAHVFHEFLLPLPPSLGAGAFKLMQQSARVMPFTENGVAMGAVAFIQDVSERVAREQELSDARQRAEIANEGKSEFLKGMSHEFRTPLNAIIGYAALLESGIGGSLAEVQKDYLQRMQMGVAHLSNMVEEILVFSAVEAQKVSVMIEAVDLGAVAASVVQLLENQAAQKGISLEAELSPAIVILTDEQRVKQILMNVVGNAIKFTSKGAVKLAMQADDTLVQFIITDTGPGIPADYRDRVFEPFVQVVDRSGEAHVKGTGLGLPLSRSLAELLGGTLQLEDSGGVGCRFTLRLPRRTN